MKFSKLTALLFCLVLLSHLAAQEQIIRSSSSIDWTKSKFDSTIVLDVLKAGIPLPSGRGTAVDKINMQLPQLLKDPLLSTAVNSSSRLGDFVLANTVSLEQLSKIIDNGKKTPSYFDEEFSGMKIAHSMTLSTIGSLMVSHRNPYMPKAPIDKVSSRAYTGIIIDARGMLPIHGEYTSSPAIPCLFPCIWDETMDLLYERNMIEPSIAKTKGVVSYSYSEIESEYQGRIGKDPLHITARKVYGVNRTDPVISRRDALKILSVPENIELLRQGKVVILLDKERLVYDVEIPVKKPSYYNTYDTIARYFFENKVPEVETEDTYKGIRLAVQDIKFIADSELIMPEEKGRLDNIAEAIRIALRSDSFTILVEGHTASVGKPSGEMNLSLLRAKSIIDEMVKRGLSEKLFTWRGYGGTVPLESNDTPEGRAKNRRVEITIQPKFDSVTWH